MKPQVLSIALASALIQIISLKFQRKAAKNVIRLAVCAKLEITKIALNVDPDIFSSPPAVSSTVHPPTSKMAKKTFAPAAFPPA